MAVVAKAPGKLVVLGEYAVLAGAPALVLAVDRYCRAEIGPSDDEFCHLRISTHELEETDLLPGSVSGVELVDLVTPAADRLDPAWSASLDSSQFFVGNTKLGVGSSAAATISKAMIAS